MSFVSFSFLGCYAPFSFFLRFYESSVVTVLGALSCSVLIYVSIEGWVVYLILLESRNVLV